jgi:hypothetical protein
VLAAIAVPTSVDIAAGKRRETGTYKAGSYRVDRGTREDPEATRPAVKAVNILPEVEEVRDADAPSRGACPRPHDASE